MPSLIDLTLEGEAGGFLHGQGAGVSLAFFGNDGSYWEGHPPFALPLQPGKLHIVHGGGWLSLWQGESGQARHDWLGRTSAIEPWSGAEDFGHGSKAFRIAVDSAKFIQFNMDQPGILAIDHGDDIIRLAFDGSARGVSMTHYFQPGDYRLLARPFQFAAATIRLSQQETPIQTDIPDAPVFIASQETQAFQFQVRQEAKVGLGLKSRSDHLNGRLISENGKILAEGNLIIEVLQPGHYLFVVNNPHEPVLFQPILIGLDGSHIDIPDEVMRQYFNSP